MLTTSSVIFFICAFSFRFGSTNNYHTPFDKSTKRSEHRKTKGMAKRFCHTFLFYFLFFVPFFFRFHSRNSSYSRRARHSSSVKRRWLPRGS